MPFFVSFIRTGIQKYCGNKILLLRLLHLLEALFSNKYLNLYPKPYLSHLVTAILSSLKTDRGRPLQLGHHQNGGHQGRSRYIDGVGGEDLFDEMKIEHVPMAANILRHALDRWSTPINLLRGQTLKALVAQLNDPGLSYVSHYGALRALIALGPRVLEEQVLPHLDRYQVHISLQSIIGFLLFQSLVSFQVSCLLGLTVQNECRPRIRQFSAREHDKWFDARYSSRGRKGCCAPPLPEPNQRSAYRRTKKSDLFLAVLALWRFSRHRVLQ